MAAPTVPATRLTRMRSNAMSLRTGSNRDAAPATTGSASARARFFLIARVAGSGPPRETGWRRRRGADKQLALARSAVDAINEQKRIRCSAAQRLRPFACLDRPVQPQRQRPTRATNPNFSRTSGQPTAAAFERRVDPARALLRPREHTYGPSDTSFVAAATDGGFVL